MAETQEWYSPNKMCVIRNDVVAIKPDWMSMEYWLEYEAPRFGKDYGKSNKPVIYGKKKMKESVAPMVKLTYDIPTDDGDCDGCKI